MKRYGIFLNISDLKNILERGRIWVLPWAYEQTFFPSAQKKFPFSNLNPFPFEAKEAKIRANNFPEM